jgi:hypothetical protein
MLYKMCWQTCRHNHRLDWDEAMGVANEAYMDAYHTFSSVGGACFSTWVFWKVRGALQRWETVELRQQHLLRTNQLHDDGDEERGLQIPDREHDMLTTMAPYLSEDARAIARVILEAPEELMEALADIDGDSNAVKSVLMEFPQDMVHMLSCWDTAKLRRGLRRLSCRWGWTLSRCMDCFRELQDALT